MLKESGTVVSIAGNRAKVSIMRSEACGHCPAKNMCSTASGNVNVLEVDNSLGAEPGEKVIIEVQPKTLVKASALLYLFPAVAMVAGATTGWLKTGTDLGTIIGTLAGLAASTFFLFLHGRRKSEIGGPVISKVLSRKRIHPAEQSHTYC